MANNPYVNKVEYAGQTLIDVTDTTATEADVAEGKVFTLASGEKGVGTLKTTPTALTCSVAQNVPITIEKNNSYRIGQMIVINLRIRVTGSYGANQVIINGFPSMLGVTQATGSTAGSASSSKKNFAIDEYGQIMCVEALASSDAVIGLSAVYIAAS